MKDDLARIRLQKSREKMKKCGFPCSAGASDGGDFTRGEVQGTLVDCGVVPEGFFIVSCCQDGVLFHKITCIGRMENRLHW